jgi:hypothetical protein
MTRFYRAYRAAIMQRAAEAIANPKPKPGLGVWASCPDYDDTHDLVPAVTARGNRFVCLKCGDELTPSDPIR